MKSPISVTRVRDQTRGNASQVGIEKPFNDPILRKPATLRKRGTDRQAPGVLLFPGSRFISNLLDVAMSDVIISPHCHGLSQRRIAREQSVNLEMVAR